MSYYDIDAILTDAQKVPCTFELDVPHLTHLDSTPSNTHTLKAGTRLHLPLWLAELLAVSSPSSSTTLITLDLPVSLSAHVLNALKASPQSVDLRAQAPHFYALGARILDLFEEDEILDVLSESFRLRAADIGDYAKRAGGGGGGAEGTEFLRGLEEWERGLFRVAHESARAVRIWMAEVKRS